MSGIESNDRFPLRGFLKYSCCGRTLTASGSRGKMGKVYTYYHCSDGCCERLPADRVNADFCKFFRQISGNKGIVDLYASILRDVYQGVDVQFKKKHHKIQEEIDKNSSRIHKAMDDQADGLIDISEYREIKRHYEEANRRLQVRKMKFGDGDGANCSGNIVHCAE